MLKYAKIINEETGLVEVGLGTNTSYYQSIGMTEMDVEQSDVDNQWYTFAKCPHKSDEQKLSEAKTKKYNEANEGAKTYIADGKALYELSATRHIEATDGNIGKFSAYALGYVTGTITGEVTWTTKEDEVISLNQTDVSQILTGLGTIQAQVWTVKFPYYKTLIEQAVSVEEVEAIVIDYDSEIFNQA